MEHKAEKVSLRVGRHVLEFDTTPIRSVVDNFVLRSPEVWERTVTPNLHHIYLLRRDPSLIAVYSNAGTVLADGWPIARLLTYIRRRPVLRVAGSDLLECLLSVDGAGKPLVLVGGRDQVALDVVARRAAVNGWSVSTEPAPAAEVDDQRLRRELLKRVAEAASGGIVVLALGAPKQEKVAAELEGYPGHGHILCLGMALNFSAGVVNRAPMWMQRSNLEWLHRIRQEVRRLLPRYIKDATCIVPLLVDNMRFR